MFQAPRRQISANVKPCIRRAEHSLGGRLESTGSGPGRSSPADTPLLNEAGCGKEAGGWGKVPVSAGGSEAPRVGWEETMEGGDLAGEEGGRPAGRVPKERGAGCGRSGSEGRERGAEWELAGWVRAGGS